MMQVSTRGRYALTIMMYLAEHADKSKVSIKEISENNGISEKYLEQIVMLLKKAGYLKSQRGAQGGYQLTDSPCNYTVGMILQNTEGNMAPVQCVGKNIIPCDHINSCAPARLWKMVDDAVNSVLDHVTLQDLIDWQQEAKEEHR